ncbi:hypothetical protein CEP53_010945 [Fusarium sp. AF-6]|nr:hypothetical protein CEP53_010945 [Fusarium sp. AF-6]
MDSAEHTITCHGQSFVSWHRLPRELQFHILSLVACCQGSTSHVEPSSEVTKRHVGQLAKCAAVCRNWQGYFENILFRKVTVHQKDLARLHKISNCRTERIQHLWLRIELLPYDCRICREFGHANDRKDGRIFEKALRNLFRVLHRWKGRNPSHTSGGLTLEISVHSPSDSQHEFQNISFDDDNNNDEGADVCTIDDPKHGWVDGRRTRQPDEMAVYDLFDLWEPLDTQPENVEWSAPVVKHLLIRRQTRRHFSQATLSRLLKRLPRLESLNMEFWRMFSGEEQSWWDDDITKLLKSHLPRRVQRVTLFEDFDEDLDSMFARDGFDQVEFIRSPSPALGAALAGLRNQKTLHVSFIVDAYDFFDELRHYRHDRAWRNLTHLSMTSILLRPQTCLSQIQRLLMMAASATHRFPNLEVLELCAE